MKRRRNESNKITRTSDNQWERNPKEGRKMLPLRKLARLSIWCWFLIADIDKVHLAFQLLLSLIGRTFAPNSFENCSHSDWN
jgi:hypothetical protein